MGAAMRMTGASLTSTPDFKLVLEAGACADDIEWAHAAVDHAAGLATHFKVQMYQAPTLTTAWAETYGDASLNEARRQWDAFCDALPYEAWREVAAHCAEVGLIFFASVFDAAAVEASEAMGMPLYKIASADITNRPLLEVVKQTGKPIVLSTGASYLWEVERALGWLAGSDVTVLACTLHYPSKVSEANMARMNTLRQVCRKVGYSDHTPGAAGIAAAKKLGACMVEKHWTITPEFQRGDHAFAVTPEQLQSIDWNLPRHIVDEYLGDPAMEPRPYEMEARRKARRSIVAAKAIKQGDKLGWDNMAFLRPGGGMEPWQAYDLIGREASHGYLPGEQIIE